MNEAVRFRSDAFSLEPTAEGDKAYDLPLGDDLAAFLRKRMLTLSPDLCIDTPIREDWGTILWVKAADVEYHVSVQWLPADAPVENLWGMTFTRLRGWLAALVGRRARPEESRPMQALVSQVLAAEPAIFRNVVWMSRAEFDASI